MLKANKAQVVAGLAHKTLEIRQMELRYWMEVFKKFGVLAAFLGGFASSVVLLNTEKAREEKGSNLLFILSSGGAMGFNLVLLTISVVCCLWGPGKALTGRGDESYRVVIELMQTMYSHSVVLFSLGLFCYMLATVFAAFTMYNFVSAATLTSVLLYFGYFLLVRSARLKATFVPNTFSTGGLRSNPIQDIGAELTGQSDPTVQGFIVDPEFGSHI
eukprot:XP_023973669.1 uncharacterized protein LOC112062962 [Physeter catodon]